MSGNRERAAYHEAGHCAAAIAFGIPIIAPSKPMRDTYRGHYRERADLALECIVTMCLTGLCGPIADGSDRADYEMARRCLARYCGPLHVEAEIVRSRDVTERVVCTVWAQECIPADCRRAAAGRDAHRATK